MTPIAILPISDTQGERTYRAITGDKQSVGKTAGQALDALTAQLDQEEFTGLLLLQSFQPDSFFTTEQQERLAELMELWRASRDQGQGLPSELQRELDQLVEGELRAATDRTASLLRLGHP